MTNRITIDLNLTGEQAVTRGFHNAGDAAEDFGDDLKKSAAQAGFLDKRLVELRGRTRELANEFARTGDKDIFKQLSGARREMGQLEKVKKQFFTVGIEIGDETRRGFVKSLGEMGGDLKGSLTAIKGPAIVGAVALAAALSPFLGAAVASAVLGAAGAGGIIGGVALAAQDARVQDEAIKLGKHLSAAFTQAAEPFIAPTIEALHVLDASVDDVADRMRVAFGSVAPLLVPLTKGLTGMIDQMLPGLIKGLEAAKPVLRVIANELPDLGKALGDFFEDIAEDPDGAIMAMKALFQITTGTIRALGEAFGWLERTFEATQKWGIAAANTIAELADKLGILSPALVVVAKILGAAKGNWQEQVDALNRAKDASGDFAGELKGVADSATEAKNKMMALNEVFLDFLGIAQGAEEANIAYERTWDEMIETLSKSAKTLDITTEAGRRNRESIEAHAKSIAERHRQRMEEGATLEQSLPIMDAEIERLRKQLIAMGLNKQAANELINIYAHWPTRAVTVIEAQGLEATKESVQELIALFRLANKIVIGGIGGANVGHRAHGGPVHAGQTYIVGEHGPELLQMGGNANGQVVNATQTAAMLSGASGGATRPLVHISPPPPSGNAMLDGFVQLIWPYILKQVRIDGGDLAAFGAA